MDAVGTSADNALAELFNATFKREVLQDRRVWPSADVCRREVFKWLTPVQHPPTTLLVRTPQPQHLQNHHHYHYAGNRRVHHPGPRPYPSLSSKWTVASFGSESQSVLSSRTRAAPVDCQNSRAPGVFALVCR